MNRAVYAWIAVCVVIAIAPVAIGIYGSARSSTVPTDPAERAAYHLRKAQEHIEAAEKALREQWHVKPAVKEVIA